MRETIGGFSWWYIHSGMDHTSDIAEQRTPPRVIRFAEPLRQPVSYLSIIITVLAAIAATGALVYGGVPAVSPIWPILFGSIFVAVAVTTFILHRRKVARYNRGILDYCDREGITIDEGVLSVLRATAQGPFPSRPDRHSTAYLKSWIADEGQDRALVLCVGQIPIPDVSDDRFEPYIITPSRHLLGYAVIWLILTAGGAYFFYAHWISHSIVWRNPLSLVMVTILVPLMCLGLFLYGFIARPTYFRFAPGVVELMQFKLGTEQTNVRSYPMVPGTLVLIGSLPQVSQRVILVRDKHVDTMVLGSMGKSDEALAYFWRAVMSTAPIPLMPQEGLLG